MHVAYAYRIASRADDLTSAFVAMPWPERRRRRFRRRGSTCRASRKERREQVRRLDDRSSAPVGMAKGRSSVLTARTIASRYSSERRSGALRRHLDRRASGAGEPTLPTQMARFARVVARPAIGDQEGPGVMVSHRAGVGRRADGSVAGSDPPAAGRGDGTARASPSRSRPAAFSGCLAEHASEVVALALLPRAVLGTPCCGFVGMLGADDPAAATGRAAGAADGAGRGRAGRCGALGDDLSPRVAARRVALP